MKRLITAALVGGFLLGSPSLRAEHKGEGMKESHHGMGKKGMGKEWKEKMEMTDAQAEKFKALMQAKHEAVMPFRKQAMEDTHKLREQLKNKADDKEIQATMERMEKSHKAIEAEQEKFKAATASLLTPTQRAKLLLHMMKRMNHEGKGRDKKETKP